MGRRADRSAIATMDGTALGSGRNGNLRAHTPEQKLQSSRLKTKDRLRDDGDG